GGELAGRLECEIENGADGEFRGVTVEHSSPPINEFYLFYSDIPLLSRTFLYPLAGKATSTAPWGQRRTSLTATPDPRNLESGFRYALFHPLRIRDSGPCLPGAFLGSVNCPGPGDRPGGKHSCPRTG